VSLTVSPEEVVGIVGPNGAGKTTLIKCAVSLSYPRTGTIRYFGHDLFNEPEKAKRYISYVPETPNLISVLTVWEYINFIALAYWAEDYEEEAKRFMRAFDIYDKKNRYPSGLSQADTATLLLFYFLSFPFLTVVGTSLSTSPALILFVISSRSLNFCTLPLPETGILSMKTTYLGTLADAIFP